MEPATVLLQYVSGDTNTNEVKEKPVLISTTYAGSSEAEAVRIGLYLNNRRNDYISENNAVEQTRRSGSYSVCT